ncbi:MAG: hypothetical protein PHI97_18720 [Desulfobulbus sp.]|nr:hypothetical protein [Desulfobulbus sp.]
METKAWELVIGTIAGFVTAFLAEPVKTYFVQRANKKILREALYREMAHLYSGWKGLMTLIEEGQINPNQLIHNIPIVSRADCYTYAKTMPVVYYALPEAAAIDVLYSNFNLVGDSSLGGAEERLKYARMALKVFEDNLRNKAVDPKLMLTVAADAQREALRKVLDLPAT